jgi:16S rRNA (guanine966-N2)-methyltransferase
MRIVGGRHRGRRLEAPANSRIRPTSDRAREALFNILVHGRFAADRRSLLLGARVLDAFCGTGALALEALSRGAAKALLLDTDAEAVRLARANAAQLGESAQVDIRRADARHPGPAPWPATLAFLDPPYASGVAGEALAALAAGGWLASGAVAVVETGAGEDPAIPSGFESLDQRRYGRGKLLFLRCLEPGKGATDG